MSHFCSDQLSCHYVLVWLSFLNKQIQHSHNASKYTQLAFLVYTTQEYVFSISLYSSLEEHQALAPLEILIISPSSKSDTTLSQG